MVQNLLKMKALLDNIWIKAFQQNGSFGHALKEAFEYFINQRANKPAELIAKFLDHELRSGSKGQTEEDLDANLDKALLLFRYISVSLSSDLSLPTCLLHKTTCQIWILFPLLESCLSKLP